MVGVLDSISNRRALRLWRRAARRAQDVDLPTLSRQRASAQRLRKHLNEVLHFAEDRLALPMIGSQAAQKPFGTDWVWRPQAWRGPLAVPGQSSVQSKTMLGRQVTLYHDCAFSELTLRQMRNTRERDLAPFGVRLDVFKFDGSFLSLVIDLPPAAVEGLTKDTIFRLDTIVEVEKPLEIFARINIKHGPNTEQIVRELPLDAEDVLVDFDLAYTRLNEKRVEKAWIDIMFEGPEMNQIILRDLTISRRPRADM